METPIAIGQSQRCDRLRHIRRGPTGTSSRPYGRLLVVVGREDRTGAGRAWLVYRLRDKSGAQRLSPGHLLALADADDTCLTGEHAAVER